MRLHRNLRLHGALSLFFVLFGPPAVSSAEPQFPELLPIVRKGDGPSLDSESLYGFSLRASLLRYWSRIPADRVTLLRVSVDLPDRAWHADGGVKSAEEARRAIEMVRQAGFKPVGFLDASPKHAGTFAVYALASTDQIARFDRQKHHASLRRIVHLELIESVAMRDKLLHPTLGIWRKRDSSNPRRPWKRELIGVIPVRVSNDQFEEYLDMRRFLISRLGDELASLNFERFVWFGSGGRLNQKVDFGFNLVTSKKWSPQLQAYLRAKFRDAGLELRSLTFEPLVEFNQTLVWVDARGTLNAFKRAISGEDFSLAAVYLAHDWRDCSRLLAGFDGSSF